MLPRLLACRRGCDLLVSLAQAQGGAARVCAPGGQHDRLRLRERQGRVLLQLARGLRIAVGGALAQRRGDAARLLLRTRLDDAVDVHAQLLDDPGQIEPRFVGHG